MDSASSAPYILVPSFANSSARCLPSKILFPGTHKSLTLSLIHESASRQLTAFDRYRNYRSHKSISNHFSSVWAAVHTVCVNKPSLFISLLSDNGHLFAIRYYDVQRTSCATFRLLINAICSATKTIVVRCTVYCYYLWLNYVISIPLSRSTACLDILIHWY